MFMMKKQEGEVSGFGAVNVIPFFMDLYMYQNIGDNS